MMLLPDELSTNYNTYISCSAALQYHLEELKQDNRQMSLRLSEAEGCLQDLDSDGRMVHHSTSLIDDFDHSVNRPAEIDRVCCSIILNLSAKLMGKVNHKFFKVPKSIRPIQIPCLFQWKCPYAPCLQFLHKRCF